jgi:hypothetical protein
VAECPLFVSEYDDRSRSRDKNPTKLDLNGLLLVLDVVMVVVVMEVVMCAAHFHSSRQRPIVSRVGWMDHPAQLDRRPSGRLRMWRSWERWTGKGGEKGALIIDAHPICSQLRAFCFGHVQRTVCRFLGCDNMIFLRSSKAWVINCESLQIEVVRQIKIFFCSFFRWSCRCTKQVNKKVAKGKVKNEFFKIIKRER